MTEVGFVENSDKLYLCQVQVTAEGEMRQVVTGLRKHVPMEDLLNHKVVVITNLKVCAPYSVSFVANRYDQGANGPDQGANGPLNEGRRPHFRGVRVSPSVRATTE